MGTTKDYLQLHFLVFLWGFTAVLGKLVSIPSVEMVFYRTVLAALGMGVLMIITKNSFLVDNDQLIKIVLTGFIVAIHWLTFFGAGRVSNPSTSLVGFATCSFWAALIEPMVKRKKIQALEIGLGVLVLGGLYIIFSFDFNFPLGLFLGIVSGFMAALFSVINSKLVTRTHAYAITFYEMMGASVFVLCYLLIDAASGSTPNFSATASDWFYIALMAWVCSVYAFSVSIDLSKRLSVFFMQLALNLEPVYGIILAIIVFGQREVMGLNFYVGTAIILSAVVIYPILKRRIERNHWSSAPPQ